MAAGWTAVLALLARWLDKELAAARWMAVLARWVHNKSAAGLTVVLGCWCVFESVSRLTAVLANQSDVESAVELTTGLLAACWCDDESEAGRTAVLALLARPARRQVSGGADGVAHSLLAGGTMSGRQGGRRCLLCSLAGSTKSWRQQGGWQCSLAGSTTSRRRG